MNLKPLEDLLPNVDVAGLWTVYAQAEPNGDIATFAGHLAEKGLLQQDQLKTMLMGSDVSFTISEALGKSGTSPSTSTVRLLGLLGKGAMGEVHIARDTDLHRNVAFKVMDPSCAKDPGLVRRFLTEVQVTAQLDHPSIVPVYGFDRRPDGSFGYTMRIIRGRTMEQFIKDTRRFYKDKRPLDEKHALSNRLLLFLELCHAVDYAHSRGVIHRDLKPANIMIGSFGEVMVMDWGIARLIGGAPDQVTAVAAPTGEGTQLGMAIGTVPYMSPEQAQGRNTELDGRSDQYALGLILYELVALKRAVTGKTTLTVYARAREAEKDPFVHAFKERIPRELSAIVAKATAEDPEDRYSTVEALATDVRRYLRDEEVVAGPDRGLQRVSRWVGKHRQLTLGAVFALLTTLIVAVSGLLLLGVLAFGAVTVLDARRQDRLAHVIAITKDQGHAIDATLLHYGGMLSALAAAAEQVLQDEPEPSKVYLAADFFEPGAGPPDLRESPVYDTKVSTDFPDNVLAPDVARESVETRLYQLAELAPLMHRLMVRSKAEDAVDLDAEARRKLILDDGAPMIWSYIGIEEGLLVGYPGTGEYPDDYDPRTMDWYVDTKGTRGLVWDASDDESGQGMLVSASTALHDRFGAFLGVAGVDVKTKRVAETMLVPPGMLNLDVALLDADGLVVAGTSLPPDLVEKPPYRHAEVIERIRQGEASGHLETGDELVVWTPLQVVPWTYVLSGSSRDLLGWW